MLDARDRRRQGGAAEGGLDGVDIETARIGSD
jgi:hypothetical protein